MDSKLGNVFTVISVLLVLALHICSAVDVEAGNEVTLTCPLSTEFPEWTGPANLATPLTNGSMVYDEDFGWAADNKSLVISSAQTIHTGEYKCSDGSTEGIVQLTVQSYTVNIEFMDTFTDLSRATLKVTDKYNLTAVCQVTGGNPAPSVTFRWWRTSTDLPDLSNVYITESTADDNTITVNASVTFTGSPDVDGGILYCVASYQSVENDTESGVYIYVLFPPLLRAHSINKFPRLGDMTVKLGCDSYSKPASTTVWRVNDQLLSNTSLSYIPPEYKCQQSTKLFYILVCSSNITINDLKKEDNGMVIKCDTIFEGETLYTSDVYTIKVPFNPTSVSLEGNVTATIDLSGTAEVSLTCATNGGNPTPELVWYKGDTSTDALNTTSFPVETLEDLYLGKNVSQTVDVTVDRTMDGRKILCCTKNVGLCDEVVLDVSYPPVIVSPTVPEYRAYIGDTMSLPCVADSKPAATMAWYKLNGTDYVMVTNNTDSPSNILHLSFTDITNDDTGSYQCRAWAETLGVETAVTVTTSLTVFDKPAFPVLMVSMVNNIPRVDITTGSEAPAVPRQFYIQYKRGDSQEWLEIARPFDDTLPGQTEKTHRYTFNNVELKPDSPYDVRVKSVDMYGLEAFSNSIMFVTDKEVVVKTEDTVSRTEFRNAILISVFATAGLFLIIIIIIACAVKNGRCQSSSSKSYVM